MAFEYDPSAAPFSYAPLEYAQPPNPEWKYGEPVTSTEQGRVWMEGLEKSGTKTFDVSKETSRFVSFVFNARWILTRHPQRYIPAHEECHSPETHCFHLVDFGGWN